MKAKNNLEDIYPLSPLQEGMLFHALAEPEAGLYHDQLVYRLRAVGGLDEAALHQAWRTVVARHGALRTTFSWERRDKPLQVVLRRVKLPFEVLDWRERDEDARSTALKELLREDRRRGFNLAKPPLIRLTLLRLDEEQYQCLLSYPHILMDAWSLSLVLGEIFQLFEASRRGLDAALEPPRPFRDYIGWLRRQDQGAAEAFWRRQLSGFSEPTPLGIEGVPVRGGGERGYQSRTGILSRANMSALSAFAQGHRLTVNHLVRAAWSLLLHRYSGEEDLVFGATVSGRPDDLPGAPSMVGLFINTLPVRVGVSPADRLLSFLEKIRAQQIELRQYEYSSLAEVRGSSDLRGQGSLFESLLVFENVPIFRLGGKERGGGAGSDEERGALELGSIRYEPRTNYALSVMVVPGETMSLRALFSGDRFDGSTIDRLIGHFRNLLAALPEEAERSLETFSMLSSGERHQVKVEWQDTAGDTPRDLCIHELFEARARRAPEAPAVCTRVAVLSYGELDRLTDRLAHHLLRLGIERGAPVAVLIDRSPEMIVALLGILKAGASYVPLEFSYPPARRQWILAALGVAAVVTRDHFLADFGGIEEEVPTLSHLICLDASDGDWGGRAKVWSLEPRTASPYEEKTPGATPRDIAPQDIAYTIFTSGSTGTPKGVTVDHRAVVQLIAWVNRTFQVGPEDRVLFITSPAFDLSVYDIFGLLAVGGAIRVASEREVREPRELMEVLVHEPVTFWDSAPAALQQVMAFLPQYHQEAAGSSLRLAFLSGDWIPVSLPDRLRGSFPRARLIALGGATEATVWSNFHAVGEVDPLWTSIPYGRPIRNATYHVLTKSLAPCPIAVPGDLLIGGECLAVGYAGEPARTAERFIPDPFTDAVGGRLYRTGDRARFFLSGELEFLGRLDQQVKIRGFRIELGEIEAALTRYPGLRDVVALVREDEPGNRRLVVYVTADPGGETPRTEDLRRHLAERLPEYMIPAAFVVLDTLPLTANGKLDRRALPAPEGALRSATGSPRTPVEEMIAGLWSEVLSGREVGVEDDFFELGGHSLLATQVTSRVLEIFGIEISLRELFEASRLADFAGLVEKIRSAPGRRVGGDPAPIERCPPGRAMPLSENQQRLWFLTQLDRQQSAYKIPSVVRLEGPLELAALEQALAAVVARHGSLRTTFETAAGEPVQIIAAEMRPTVPLADLRALSASRRPAEARRQIGQLVDRPFDLEQGPLWRVTVLRLGKEEHIVVLVMHHIISDAWSMAILVGEMMRLYAAVLAGRPANLPEPRFEYADYVRWQREQVGREGLEAQLAYWQRQLAGEIPQILLPGARQRPERPTFRGAMEHLRIDGPVRQALVRLSRDAGATLFMTLLAAFKALLALYTREEDIAVGANIANRPRGDLEGVIGYFANIVVLRTDLSGDLTFRQLLHRVRGVALDAYAHQTIPFEHVREALRPQRRGKTESLFQVKFSFMDVPGTPTELPGLTLHPVELEHDAANFDLTLFVTAEGKALRVAAEYNTDLYEARFMSHLMIRFEAVLEQITRDPDQKIDQLVLVDDGTAVVGSAPEAVPAGFGDDLEKWD